MREPFPPCLGSYERAPSRFRAPGVVRPLARWPLLLILAGLLGAIFAAARLALGGL